MMFWSLDCSLAAVGVGEGEPRGCEGTATSGLGTVVHLCFRKPPGTWGLVLSRGFLGGWAGPRLTTCVGRGL